MFQCDELQKLGPLYPFTPARMPGVSCSPDRGISVSVSLYGSVASEWYNTQKKIKQAREKISFSRACFIFFCVLYFFFRPWPSNAIVGSGGSGDASALPTVYLKKTSRASLLI